MASDRGTQGPRRRRPEIAAVAAAALAAVDQVLQRWLPGGKRAGAEYVCRNPRRSDERPGSFSVNTSTGRWADFASGDRGGDVVSLIAFLEQTGQRDAADKLAEFLGMTGAATSEPARAPTKPDPPTAQPACPVPSDAPPAPAAHPQHGRPSATWVYRDASGLELMRVYRFDKAGGKIVLPMTCWRDPGGLRWHWKGLPGVRPLYGLDRLAERPGAPVIVTEGERDCDAAAALLPGYVAVTSPNGAKSAERADWTPLAGRAVVIWPDFDPPGAEFAADVARLTRAAGARSVATLDPSTLAALRPGDQAAEPLAPGWGAADALAAGIPPDALGELLDRLASAPTAKASKTRAPGASTPRAPMPAAGGRFDLLDEDEPEGRRAGVYWVPMHRDREGAMLEGPAEWLCGPLQVVALARDACGDRWGPVLKFRTADSSERLWAMPAAWASGDGREAREALLDRGLQLTTDSRRRARLLAYIMESRPGCFARAAERTGWFGNCFVLPSGEVIGDPGAEPLILQGASGEGAKLATAGTLEGWTRDVAAPCEPHARLVLAVSLAFGALLLGLSGQESGGLHFRGGSSLGKSSALALAASVFGSPAPGSGFLRSWRLTDNGLEGLAAHHSGLLLALDELAELAPTAAAAAGYMLSNGQGKGRLRRDGSPRPQAVWNLLFFSAGEIGLADLIAQSGGRAMAGQEVRLIDLPADAGEGLGILSTAPQGMAPGAFVERLRAAALAHHGHAARAFLARVVERVDTVRELLAAYVPAFGRDVAGDDAAGQVRRVAARFGLIACGGMLATQLGLTGWAEHTAGTAARRCFEDWLASRPAGRRDSEPAEMLAAVRHFLEQNAEGRFMGWDRGEDDRAPRTLAACGWRKKTEHGREFLIFAESWRRDVCKGFDAAQVARVLAKCGALMTESDGCTTRRERLPDGSKMRVYRVLPALWQATP